MFKQNLLRIFCWHHVSNYVKQNHSLIAEYLNIYHNVNQSDKYELNERKNVFYTQLLLLNEFLNNL